MKQPPWTIKNYLKKHNKGFLPNNLDPNVVPDDYSIGEATVSFKADDSIIGTNRNIVEAEVTRHLDKGSSQMAS